VHISKICLVTDALQTFPEAKFISSIPTKSTTVANPVVYIK